MNQEDHEDMMLQFLALVTLNPKSLKDTDHAEYDRRRQLCGVKKYRWCACLGLGLG